MKSTSQTLVSRIKALIILCLAEALGDMADRISDSESIVSIGELNDEGCLDVGHNDQDTVDENLNNPEGGVDGLTCAMMRF
jgi:hypothetical protein